MDIVEWLDGYLRWNGKDEIARAVKAEIERLRKQIRYQEHRDGRISTHDPVCYVYGPSHYECALQEIERLREQCEFEKKCRNDAFEELKQRDADIERLRETLGTTCDGRRDADKSYAELFGDKYGWVELRLKPVPH